MSHNSFVLIHNLQEYFAVYVVYKILVSVLIIIQRMVICSNPIHASSIYRQISIFNK